jgi:hypothetical protein
MAVLTIIQSVVSVPTTGNHTKRAIPHEDKITYYTEYKRNLLSGEHIFQRATLVEGLAITTMQMGAWLKLCACTKANGIHGDSPSQPLP